MFSIFSHIGFSESLFIDLPLGLPTCEMTKILALFANKNFNLFKLTISGLGLTGFIHWAKIKLIPIKSSSMHVENIRFNNLEEYFITNNKSKLYRISKQNFKIEILKNEWGKGKTASQIAEIIGGISRNAVIGKAHRLNLSAKIKTRSANQNQKN